jgi:hypothetical protein
VAEPLRDLGAVGLTVERIGGGRRPQRMGADLGSEAEAPWVVGLRHRALIGVLVYTFARISAVQRSHCLAGTRKPAEEEDAVLAEYAFELCLVTLIADKPILGDKVQVRIDSEPNPLHFVLRWPELRSEAFHDWERPRLYVTTLGLSTLV